MQNLLHFDEPAKPEDTAQTSAAGIPQSGAQLAGDISQEDGGQGLPPGMVAVPASMVPGLLKEGVEAATSDGPMQAMQPFQPQEGQTVQMVDQAKLMEILSSIQEKLNTSANESIPSSMEDVEKLDISQSLGEFLLESQEDENVVSAVDRQSSDIINLVNLLYDAIWQDPSVPIPIKELIGRTQITIIKVALEDVEFFNNENHPARAVLNEYASAGIGWTEVEELEKDPLYQKIREQVDRIVAYQNDNQLFIDLINDFRNFRAQEAAKTRQLEQRILKAKERNERLDDIHELVNQKIEERILGRELDTFVEELLKGPFHKFMVMLVLKEGPGGNAWKQSINTIDVLLWSVQPHEEGGDRDRLATINPRLLNNLRKAFRIASIEKSEIDELIERLEQVQDESFQSLADETSEGDSHEASTRTDAEAPSVDDKIVDSEESEATTEDTSDGENASTPAPPVRFLKAGEDVAEAENETADGTLEADDPEDVGDTLSKPVATEPVLESSPAKEGDALPAEDDAGDSPEEVQEEVQEEEMTDEHPCMKQVDNLSVGVWVEFAGADDNNTRCKLAAKISAIDKFIFVNRQGVKVVEKTKLGLARELRDGTVSIISDGLLFSRALESVIGNLRESQHEQQTGSAYQPAESASNE